ncbi:MAG: YdiU family protein [Pseudomonadota bacterium]|nr:YdiU family protein [Pseudomonadota bacterium]
MRAPVPFDNSYARLPEHFYARVQPTPVSRPELVRFNRSLAAQLGLDADVMSSSPWADAFAGNYVPEGAEPLAMAYAGHQFGHWVPQLGDGRAILLGEWVGSDGIRRDLHLKGAGPTPFSRGGDGRAVLGPVMREYIVAEAMAALGIPTTRALAMALTGDEVFRETPQPGAVLTRLARSHVRVGTFEYFHHNGHPDAVKRLADYVIDRNYPEAAEADNPYLTLLASVCERTADLVASWMMVGFIHGVMNTDNLSVAGETIDYGPCAFMDAFHPRTVFSSIDTRGRYAYDQQARIGHWNLAQLAGALLRLLGEREDHAMAAAQTALDGYAQRFDSAYRAGLRRKLGLASAEDGDLDLAKALLQAMANSGADFTLTFRRLSALGDKASARDEPVRSLFKDPTAFDTWAKQWRARLSREGQSEASRQAAMRAANPAYIPRNHRIQQAIDAATEARDFKPMDELMTVLTNPYEDHPNLAHYADPPAPDEAVTTTFCGT